MNRMYSNANETPSIRQVDTTLDSAYVESG